MLRGVLGKAVRLAGYTIQYGCIAHCVFEYVGGVVMCSGPSMEPTIQSSDIVFAENLSRHFYSIQRGDIVIAKSPSDPRSNICKRVVGLEGDKILTSSPSDIFKSSSYIEEVPNNVTHYTLPKQGTCLFANSGDKSRTTHPFLSNSSRFCVAQASFKFMIPLLQSPELGFEVPTGHVWLEGDNLRNSTDSRYYGPIPYGLIRGRIFFKIWPFSDFGFLRDSPNAHRFSDD